jgi:hypothetical protein
MREKIIFEDPTFRERFEKSYTKDASGCWLWTGSVTDKGYGITYVRGHRKTFGAHRASVVLSGRDIPDGFHVDHLCRVRNCVNPSHLDVVLPKDNTLRGFGPTAINARKSHCHRGHELTGYNVIMKRGKRHCRVCQRAFETAYKNRKKAELLNKEAA